MRKEAIIQMFKEGLYHYDQKKEDTYHLPQPQPQIDQKSIGNYRRQTRERACTKYSRPGKTKWVAATPAP